MIVTIFKKGNSLWPIQWDLPTISRQKDPRRSPTTATAGSYMKHNVVSDQNVAQQTSVLLLVKEQCRTNVVNKGVTYTLPLSM